AHGRHRPSGHLLAPTTNSYPGAELVRCTLRARHSGTSSARRSVRPRLRAPQAPPREPPASSPRRARSHRQRRHHLARAPPAATPPTRTPVPSSYGARYELGTQVRARQRARVRPRLPHRARAAPPRTRRLAPAARAPPPATPPTRTAAPSSYGARYELGTQVRARQEASVRECAAPGGPARARSLASSGAAPPSRPVGLLPRERLPSGVWNACRPTPSSRVRFAR